MGVGATKRRESMALRALVRGAARQQETSRATEEFLTKDTPLRITPRRRRRRNVHEYLPVAVFRRADERVAVRRERGEDALPAGEHDRRGAVVGVANALAAQHRREL